MSVVNKAILFIILMGIALSVSTCKKEPLEEGRCKLKFKTVSKHDSMIVALATQYLESTTVKPHELKDLPEGLVADYVYFLAETGDINTPIVLTSYSKLERSMLYMDTNADGRLSDEQPFRVKIKKLPRRGGKEYKYGPVSIKSRDGQGGFETKFSAKTYHGRQLALQPSGYRVGKMRLGENTYKVAVMDGNYDGRYDKIFSPPVERLYQPGCDIFAIDLGNGDKKWHLSISQRSEIMPLGRMVKVQNTYYGINIASDGTTLELKKVEPEFGTLDFGGANMKLKLWSDVGDQYLFGSEGRWEIPAGIYSILLVELNEFDSEQNVWTFSSRPDAGPLRDFEIRAGQTTSFRLGPPFSIKTDARQVGDKVSIGLKLEGCAKERYRFPILKGGKRQPAPSFKVVNEAGMKLASGHFEYG